VALAATGSIRASTTVLGAGIIALLVGAGAAQAEPQRVGLMLDAGLPEGMSGAVAYRPLPRWRLHAGVGHNMVGPGVRAGVSARAATGAVSPSLALEAGHFFRSRAGWLAGAVDARDEDGELDEISYDFASARVGLELGGGDAVFYVEGGVSWILGDLYFAEHMNDSSADVEIRSQSELEFFTASGRAGVLLWF